MSQVPDAHRLGQKIDKAGLGWAWEAGTISSGPDAHNRRWDGIITSLWWYRIDFTQQENQEEVFQSSQKCSARYEWRTGSEEWHWIDNRGNWNWNELIQMILSYLIPFI